jgi:hypothetical protein
MIDSQASILCWILLHQLEPQLLCISCLSRVPQGLVLMPMSSRFVYRTPPPSPASTSCTLPGAVVYALEPQNATIDRQQIVIT